MNNPAHKALQKKITMKEIMERARAKRTSAQIADIEEGRKSIQGHKYTVPTEKEKRDFQRKTGRGYNE